MNKKITLRTGIISVTATSALLSAIAVPLIAVPSANALSNSSYVTLNTFSGHPATILTISGGGYSGNETVAISIVENGTQIGSKTVIADDGGSFSTTVSLPTKLAQGSALVTAMGLTSQVSSSNSYYVTPFTPALTTSASSSDPFAPLTVKGSGYAPNEVVSFNFAGTTSTVTTDATGSFSATTLSTPDVPAASYTLVGTGVSSGASAIAYQYINSFYASASPTSYYVLPATNLGFNGSGFAAGETIVVTDTDSGVVLSTFKANASGSFSNGGGFSVPAAFAGNSKLFTLTGSTSHAVATTSSTVGKYYPSVSPSVYYTMPGTSVGFNGSGFASGEMIDVMNNGVKLGIISADSEGILANVGSFIVPANLAGTVQTYILIGQTSKGEGSASIQIGNYSPNVSPSSYYATPGSTVTFSGSGYAPGETIVVLSGTKTLTSFITDETGSFTALGGIEIAYKQANTTASVTLVGSTSNMPSTLSFGVGQLSTQVTPSSYYVLPYEAFSISASGFAPNEVLNLMNGSVFVATTTSNKLGVGTFTNVSLPTSTLSSVQLTVIGVTSEGTGSVGIGMGRYTPSASADNYYVKPGTAVTIFGTSFVPNELVTVSAGSYSITTKADMTGAVSTLFTIPFGQTMSSVAVSLSGSLSMAVTSTVLTLAPYTPEVSPSTYYAAPGSDVSFTGSGYVANETITVSLNGILIGTIRADATGSFVSDSFTLPYSSTAIYTLHGSLSNATNVVSVGLAQFYAGAQLDSYYGNGGSVVKVTGNGYAANETITISYGSTIIGTAKADKNGAFTQLITMPYVEAGSITITVTGDLSKALATTGYTIAQAYNSINLESYAVAAGSAVTMSGSGYFANEPIVITMDRSSVSKTITAPEDGTFTDNSFVLPVDLVPGELVLTITGTYSFTVHTITIYVLPSKA